MVETLKVKPWGDDQGDHVVINADDFDPAVHTLLDAPEQPKSTASKPTPTLKKRAVKPRAKK